MENRLESLRKVPLFSSLSIQDLNEIISISRQKNYVKGNVIINQGDEGSLLFVLLSGTVKISLLDSHGKEIIIRRLYKDNFFGEMSLLDGQKRSTTVTALEDTKALIIYRNEFNLLIQQKPHVVLEILATLNRRLRTATEKISSLKFLDAWGKVAEVLLNLYSQIDGEKNSPKGIERSSLAHSREDMAKIAGISRETFARTLNELESSGYIKIDNKDIIIIAPAKLKEIISREL
jgi:CRP/FNR family cyclic AMP-dependent transcriptional regulator